MIGNDVVDLRPDGEAPRAVSARFDARVFTGAEREAIAASVDPQRTRWTLWAGKEAAYKATKRVDRATVWSPVGFEVSLDEPAGRGRVLHESGACALRLFPAPGTVHVLALREELARLDADGFARPDGPLLHACRRGPVVDASAEVRDLARSVLAKRLGSAVGDIEFRRDERIPELWCRGTATRAPLSLSHHGDLVAFACWLEPSGSESLGVAP